MMSRITILKVIQELPLEEQEGLISELFTLFAGVKEPPAAPQAARLLGILANGKIPPIAHLM